MAARREEVDQARAERGGVFACLAGLLALALARWPQLQSPHPYSVVIALVAFSAQGISSGRTVFLIGATDD